MNTSRTANIVKAELAQTLIKLKEQQDAHYANPYDDSYLEDCLSLIRKELALNLELNELDPLPP